MQTIWRLRVAYSISKPTRAQEHARVRAPTHPHTHTHADGRTHAYACPHPREREHTNRSHVYRFPRQQWFRERA